MEKGHGNTRRPTSNEAMRKNARSHLTNRLRDRFAASEWDVNGPHPNWGPFTAQAQQQAGQRCTNACRRHTQTPGCFGRVCNGPNDTKPE